MTAFQPLSDQVLVKVLPFEEKHKSIWIPETADHGRLPIREGIVVALGTGDVVAPKCDCECHEHKRMEFACPNCGGTGYLPYERTAFSVKVGDRVLLHPRPWAEIELDGDPHIVCHEDQGVLAVLDDEA